MAIEVDPNGRHVSVQVRPPLWIGLPWTLVPHSSPLLIPLLHTVAASSLHPELTRQVLRAAFEIASHLPEPWKLWISDVKLVLAADRRFTPSEQADATLALQSLLKALESLVRATPVAAWRRALVHAWSVAAEELGGELELDPVVLACTRAGLRAEVTVELAEGVPTTSVRVVAKLPPVRLAMSPALATVGALGCEVRDAADGLIVVRAGLVASAPALEQIIEAAIALALERREGDGPYR